MRRNTIDPDLRLKETFIREFSHHGLPSKAMRTAGITGFTLRRWRAEDPDFDDAYADAEGEYRDRFIAHHQNLCFNGIDEPIIGGLHRDQVIATKKVYPLQLIAMELKKIDNRYRDIRTNDGPALLQNSTGVLAMPPTPSNEEWKKLAEEVKVIHDNRPKEE